MNQLRVLLLVTLALLVAGAVSARVPRVMGYQGVVLDGSGNPVPGPVTLVFNIYEEDEGGGALVWTETHTSVPLTGGVFDVELGTMSILNFPFDQAYEIEVESPPGNVLSPRKRLTAAPYSLGARNIDDGVAVRSLNGLTDDLDLVAGTNVSITPQGDSALVIASSGGVFGSPDSDWQILGNDMYSLPTGRVGVGATSPSAKLHVYTQNENGTVLRVEDGGTASAFGISLLSMEAFGATGWLQVVGNASNPNLLLATMDDGMSMDIQSYEELTFQSGNQDRLVLQTNGQADFLADDALNSVVVDPDWTGGNGRVLVKNTSGGIAVDSRASSLGTSGEVLINNASGTRMWLEGGASGSSGAGARMRMYNGAGNERVRIEAAEGGSTTNGAQFALTNGENTETIVLDADLGGTDGAQLVLRNGAGVTTVEIRGQESTDDLNGAALYLNDDLGNRTIELDADFGGTGEGRIITEVLEITGGADLSEQFDIAGPGLEPGTVVVIDPSRPGGLARSTHAYDKRVAGVISGAGGVKPGMVMGQRGSVADGAHPVALTGRVYVKVDASHGAIEPGDLLTTSPTPGHAMKATDFDRAHGTILGKAMTARESGTGLVLVLVTLQ